jgi:hypothetical protein
MEAYFGFALAGRLLNMPRLKIIQAINMNGLAVFQNEIWAVGVAIGRPISSSEHFITVLTILYIVSETSG